MTLALTLAVVAAVSWGVERRLRRHTEAQLYEVRRAGAVELAECREQLARHEAPAPCATRHPCRLRVVK